MASSKQISEWLLQYAIEIENGSLQKRSILGSRPDPVDVEIVARDMERRGEARELENTLDQICDVVGVRDPSTALGAISILKEEIRALRLLGFPARMLRRWQ